MARRNTVTTRPTDAELDILAVLWEHGPSTVRQVHAVLGERRRVGYTTALKMLQIMADKGLVHRDESARSHVYRAAASETKTQKQLVRDLMERAFGGSAQKLIMQALAAKRTSPKQLAELRELLDQLDGEQS